MSDAVRITVAASRGSAPREPGAAMLVRADGTEGTIGGGALEWEAMRLARAMLADGLPEMRRTFPLGPALGQCCGGSVTLAFRATGAMPVPRGAPLWIWGAGHVGRALVHSLSPLPDFFLSWVDTDAARFPQDIPGNVHRIVAADPVTLAPHAGAAAHHLIVTYSHEIDLALCDVLLRRGFASCGLIGSATKWARFRRRLAQLGHRPDRIDRILCPIGDPSLGKHPQAIAIGVAARLLGRQEPAESVARPRRGAITAGGT